MKKLNNIAGLLILTGFVLLGISFFKTGGNFEKVYNEEIIQEEKTYKASDVSKLEFDATSTNIKITGVESANQVTVSYPQSKNRKFELSNANGRLKIKEKIINKFWGFFSFAFSSTRTVEVTLPKDLLEELVVDGTSGNINIQQLKVKGNVSIESTSGNIGMEDSTINEKLEIDLTSGNTKLRNLVTGDFILSSTSGNAKLRTVQVKNKTQMDVTSGNVELADFIPGQETYLETTSGTISGQLPGKMTDYIIRSDVNHGDNSLPESLDGGGSKKLTVETTSGDIDISFKN